MFPKDADELTSGVDLDQSYTDLHSLLSTTCPHARNTAPDKRGY